MKYIIEEEELKDLVSGYYTFSGQPVYKWVNDFLKSKTPVEKIADGELFYKGKKSWIRNAEYKNKADPVFKKYEGKNIKIYIEVSK